MRNKELYRRVFIDTNVLIGNFRGLPDDVKAIKYLFSLKDHELFTSSLALSQTISTLQGKRKSLEYRLSIVDYVLLVMQKVKNHCSGWKRYFKRIKVIKHRFGR